MNYLDLLSKSILTAIGFTISIRIAISMIIDGRLGRHSRRKKKKRSSGQSLGEWFMYARYDDIVPGAMVLWQMIIVIMGIAYSIALIILYFSDSELGRI